MRPQTSTYIHKYMFTYIGMYCREEKEGKKIAMMFPSEQELALMGAAGKNTSYSYDQVFSPASTQEQVYEETRPLITSVRCSVEQH